MKFLALFSVGLLTLSPHPGASESNNFAQGQPLSQNTGRWSANVVLTPTPAAPTGASGVACLEAENGRGANPATLLVKTRQLSPGGYWLRAVRGSDGSEIPLGLIAIINPADQPEREAGDDRNQRSSAYLADFLESQTQVELPPDLAPADIAQIILSDPGGNDLLKGTVRAK